MFVVGRTAEQPWKLADMTVRRQFDGALTAEASRLFNAPLPAVHSKLECTGTRPQRC
jgi:hypothetical protein